MKTLTLILSLLLPSLVMAADVGQDFDALGENQEIIERVRKLNPSKKVQIVQNRLVDRDLRFEVGLNYGYISGGDSYVSSTNLGGQLEFHINPRWSLGGRYYKFFNELTSEGDQQFQRGKDGQTDIPAINYPLSAALGTISFYPIYGKVNMFNLTTAQFDMYLLAGAGQMQLETGDSTLFTGGGGAGFWFNQHLSGRLEVRYETYEDQVADLNRRIDSVVISFGLGILL